MTLPKQRIESLDLLKGLVVVIMALDHVRDYFHDAAFLFNPTDPERSTLPIFFTRFITHYCAPIFSFLAGLSAFMVGRRKSPKELSLFLLKRGAWLIFLEVTLVAFAWQFDPLFRVEGFAVIFALGFSMISLAALIHLPRKVLLIFCIAVIFGHNLLDGIHFPGSFVWAVFHEQQLFRMSGDYLFYMDYPIIPWIGIMALGYCFGPMYDLSFDSGKRRKILMMIGASSLILFVLLRWSNVYGDPVEWKVYDTGSKTLMSFLQVTKYPPSLLYILVTLGVGLIILAYTEQAKGPVVRFFSTFGRVPFFYYVLHIPLIHLLAMVAAQLTGYGWQSMIMSKWITEVPELRGYGFHLWTVYAVWIFVVMSLYPLCKKFDSYKQHHKDKWWLSYL